MSQKFFINMRNPSGEKSTRFIRPLLLPDIMSCMFVANELPDGDISPDGECECMAYGNCVKNLGEVHMKKYEYSPGIREIPRVRENEVHVAGERHVFDHNEHVCHSQAGEYPVNGRSAHLSPR